MYHTIPVLRLSSPAVYLPALVPLPLGVGKPASIEVFEAAIDQERILAVLHPGVEDVAALLDVQDFQRIDGKVRATVISVARARVLEAFEDDGVPFIACEIIEDSPAALKTRQALDAVIGWIRSNPELPDEAAQFFESGAVPPARLVDLAAFNAPVDWSTKLELFRTLDTEARAVKVRSLYDGDS